MHLKSLKVFCDVVQRRSFSRAAELNGISQSGASQLVHQLEERLSVKLIDRSRRPLVPTPEGRIYYEGCREIVQRYDDLEGEVRTHHEEVAGRVVVASIYSVGLHHMNRYLKEFMVQYPKANVRLEYQHPEQVYELVGSDRADLGLVSYPKASRAIKAIEWRDEPMVLVCSPNHSFADWSSVELECLDGCDVVGFVSRLRIRREIDRALSAHGAVARMVMEFDNIETIKRAVEIDAGVSLLPEPTVLREVQSGTLVAIPIQDASLVRPLGIIFRRRKQLCRAARRFMELLGDNANQLQAEEGDGASGNGTVGKGPVGKRPVGKGGRGKPAGVVQQERCGNESGKPVNRRRAIAK